MANTAAAVRPFTPKVRVDPLQMLLHRPGADAEPMGDVFIRMAFRQMMQDLTFPVRQPDQFSALFEKVGRTTVELAKMVVLGLRTLVGQTFYSGNTPFGVLLNGSC